MISKSQLREIASFDSDRNLVTSVYLAIGGQRTSAQALLRTVQLLREGRDSLKSISDPRRAWIEEDADEIRRFVAGDMSRWIDPERDRGVAIFSCSRRNFWRVVPFAASVDDGISMGIFPNLLPLVNILQRASPIGIVLTDQEKARFFVVELGHIRECDAIVDFISGRTPPDSRHFQQHEYKIAPYTQHRVEQHLRHVAAGIEDFLEREGVDWLLVGGPQEVLPELGRVMPNHLGASVKAYLAGVPVIAPEDEVLRAAQAVIQEVRDLELDTLLSAGFDLDAPADRAVTDIERVLEASGFGAVSMLLIEKDMRLSGALCRSCGRLSTEILEPCPTCGTVDRLMMNDLLPALVVQALRQDAEIRLVPSTSPWARRHHMGALLRYPLPAVRDATSRPSLSL